MAALKLVTPAAVSNGRYATHRTDERWLEVLPHLDPRYGGLSAVVPRLAAELTESSGMDVRLAAFCSPDEAAFAQQQQAEWLSLWPLGRAPWLTDRELKARFRGEVSNSRGVHIHGLWESSTEAAASEARRAGVPYIVSAHGMLERWALRNKRWKKALYAALLERRNVAEAACLHALTEAEAEDYRRFGCRGPIAIIPNGVEADRKSTPTRFLQAFPQADGKQIVLFLGRIHYKKGVDLLVDAWGQLADSFPDALLVLAGPDSEGTLATVQQTVQRLQLTDRVLFTGMLDAPLKWSALAAATCFVLPSYSEGLSVAALEAMSMGVPLILSHECNLPGIAQHGAGWLVETNVASLSEALRAALACSTDQQRTFRNNARALAEREYSWQSVAGRMAEVYRWVSGGPRPQGVQLLEAGA